MSNRIECREILSANHSILKRLSEEYQRDGKRTWMNLWTMSVWMLTVELTGKEG